MRAKPSKMAVECLKILVLNRTFYFRNRYRETFRPCNAPRQANRYQGNILVPVENRMRSQSINLVLILNSTMIQNLSDKNRFSRQFATENRLANILEATSHCAWGEKNSINHAVSSCAVIFQDFLNEAEAE